MITALIILAIIAVLATVLGYVNIGRMLSGEDLTVGSMMVHLVLGGVSYLSAIAFLVLFVVYLVKY